MDDNNVACTHSLVFLHFIVHVWTFFDHIKDARQKIFFLWIPSFEDASRTTSFTLRVCVARKYQHIALWRLYRVSTISEKKDELFAIEWHEMHLLGFEADTACIIVTETAISMAIEMKPLTAHSFFVSFQFLSFLSYFLFTNSIYILAFSFPKLDLSPLRWTIIHRLFDLERNMNPRFCFFLHTKKNVHEYQSKDEQNSNELWIW